MNEQSKQRIDKWLTDNNQRIIDAKYAKKLAHERWMRMSTEAANYLEKTSVAVPSFAEICKLMQRKVNTPLYEVALQLVKPIYEEKYNLPYLNFDFSFYDDPFEYIRRVNCKVRHSTEHQINGFLVTSVYEIQADSSNLSSVLVDAVTCAKPIERIGYITERTKNIRLS